MKNIIKAVLCLVFLFGLSVGKVNAWTASDLLRDARVQEEIDSDVILQEQIRPPIKDNIVPLITIAPTSTMTPTPIVVTQIITATPNPTVAVTQTEPTKAENDTSDTNVEKETEETGETLGEETTTETDDQEKEDEEDTKETNSNNWFWGVIIGLLALILVAQLWSTKEKKAKKDEQDDIQS